MRRQAGYILSRFSFLAMLEQVRLTKGQCRGHDGGGWWEDAFVGGCLELAGVQFTHSTLFGCDKHPIPNPQAFGGEVMVKPIRFVAQRSNF